MRERDRKELSRTLFCSSVNGLYRATLPNDLDKHMTAENGAVHYLFITTFLPATRRHEWNRWHRCVPYFNCCCQVEKEKEEEDLSVQPV